MSRSVWCRLCVLGMLGTLPLALTGCVAVVGAAAGGAAVVGSDSRTVNNMVYDETIEQKGHDILYSNALLSDKEQFSVGIYSMSGNVLLAGQTTNTDYLNWCIQQIKKLDYVRNVYNYVRPQKPVSASVTAKDALITSQIKSKLLFGKQINSGRFKVVTENSEVFLMGYVNPDEATRAVNLVKDMQDVKKIYTIFDYMTNEAILKPKAQQQNSLQVKKVEDSTATGSVSSSAGGSYVQSAPAAPAAAPVSSGNSSTYITPVDNAANGGAYIVDDSSADLLAPAQPGAGY